MFTVKTRRMFVFFCFLCILCFFAVAMQCCEDCSKKQVQLVVSIPAKRLWLCVICSLKQVSKANVIISPQQKVRQFFKKKQYFFSFQNCKSF